VQSHACVGTKDITGRWAQSGCAVRGAQAQGGAAVRPPAAQAAGLVYLMFVPSPCGQIFRAAVMPRGMVLLHNMRISVTGE